MACMYITDDRRGRALALPCRAGEIVFTSACYRDGMAASNI